MAAADYTALQAQLSRWAGGSSDTNFPEMVRDAIRFAEQDMDTMLWVPERIVRRIVDYTAEFEALPDDCSKVISVRRIVDGAEDDILERVHPDAMPGIARTYSGQKPSWYALVGAQLQFAPKPTVESPLRARLIHYAMVPRLSDESACTAILTTYPAVYLYTALKHLASFADDAGSVGKWAGLSDQAITAANRAGVVR